ncbi:hypothetical protein PBY51_019719 [Eleginops maclovinus]|uniref:Uncharacterized protein n=1 Tax=Eleginops maclovinus TaxID=56733 RepID=A0AAN8AK02_ELEMC|nr:hypothetical protein PBY51_019719 [Eleginops maclovinus]
MHVAGAVASQRWDRPAQKRSLLRQHMAIEECGLQGGRSSTCRPRHAAGKQQMHRNLDTDCFCFSPLVQHNTNEQTGQETLGQKCINAL